MWRPGGTANRIFGEEASKSATWGHHQRNQRKWDEGGKEDKAKTLGQRNKQKLEQIKQKR